MLGYAVVFFAIWWAWMNFTWFASAYDTDDVPYRLLVLVQIAGVLVLAAGVAARVRRRWTSASIVAGYVLMRVGMVAQWLRAARSRPRAARGPRCATRRASRAAGRLGSACCCCPHALHLPGWLVLALGELAVPVWAERAARRPGTRTTSPSATACSR